MTSVNKVFFNTLITYVRASITVFITLYTTRIVLEALGEKDFGLFNVVSGIVTVMAFLNVTMSNSTQRYISFSIGKNNLKELGRVFANSLVANIIICAIVIFIIEVTGNYLIDHSLQIDSDRHNDAKYLLHFSAGSIAFIILTSSFEALIISYENMVFLAIANTVDAILRLCIGIYLTFHATGDKLLFYGFLSMVLVALISAIKVVYSICKYKVKPSRVHKDFSKKGFLELIGFSGWNLFGALSAVGKSQGSGVLLNVFFVTSINAAYGIAYQVNAQLMFFARTMLVAIRPQIIKSEGSNDRNRTIRLSIVANKFAFYLFTFIALPFYVKTPYILSLWLVEVPKYAVEFCRAVIILTAINQLNAGLMTAIQAVGKVKVYQIVAGSIQLMVLPLGYLFFFNGFSPYSIMVVAICLEIISTVFRVLYFSRITGYPIESYIKSVFVFNLISLTPVIIILYLVTGTFSNSIYDLLFICGLSTLVYGLLIVTIGMDKDDRSHFEQFFISIKNKLKK